MPGRRRQVGLHFGALLIEGQGRPQPGQHGLPGARIAQKGHGQGVQARLDGLLGGLQGVGR